VAELVCGRGGDFFVGHSDFADLHYAGVPFIPLKANGFRKRKEVDVAVHLLESRTNPLADRSVRDLRPWQGSY
jgi:hypothetical protein